MRLGAKSKLSVSKTLYNGMFLSGDSLQVIETQFRPVQLNERICCGGYIRDLKSGAVIREMPKRFRVFDDPECVLGSD